MLFVKVVASFTDADFWLRFATDDLVVVVSMRSEPSHLMGIEHTVDIED